MPHLTNSTGALDRAALRYLARVVEAEHPSDEPFVLSTAERRLVRWGGIATILFSALLGVGTALLFFLPHRFWPAWFSKSHIGYWDWPLISLLYALLLAYLEIYVLQVLHSLSVRFMGLVCQFPRYHDNAYYKHLMAVEAGLRRAGWWRQLMSPAPLVPLNIGSFLWMSMLKALLTGLILYGVLHQFPAGATVGFLFVTAVGLAAWNAWATFRILEDALIRIITPLTVRQFVNELVDEHGPDCVLCDWIPTVLRIAGIVQPPDRYSHLLLVRPLASRFGVDGQMRPDAALDLTHCPSDLQPSLERLLLFSMLIDGRLSAAECGSLRRLRAVGWLKTSLSTVRKTRRAYVRGEGLWI